MEKGKIKFWNPNKGFGFIELEGKEKDLFFHVEDFPELKLRLNEEVEFEIIEDKKGKGDRAVKIKRIK